jgi:Ca2+-binding EF-hand superfamily protein
MRKMMFGLFTAAAMTGAAPLWAQDGLFDKLDTNQDGFVTKDEVPEERRSLFERMLRTSDKNEDQKLNKEEVAAALQNRDTPRTPVEGEGRPGQRFEPKQIFERFDANKDGKLSKDEAPGRLKENFDRFDANQNGEINIAEFERIAGGRPGEGRPEGPPPRRPDAPPEGRPGMGMIPVLRALDADGDDEVSADELKNASAALAKLDKNGDGKLTRDELLPEFRGFGGRPGDGPPPGRRPNPEELMSRLKAADADGDGKISKEEAPPMMKENFGRIDTNSDGFVDAAEVRQMLERFRGGPGGEGRRPDGARPEGRRPEDRRPDGARPEGRRPEGESPAEPK